MNNIETMKLARSVISSINQGKQHALTVNDETVFWQREEWVRWALDEVLPAIEQAIEQAQQPEPVAWYDEKGVITPNPLEFSKPLYTSPPQRQPLTDEEMFAIAKKIGFDSELMKLNHDRGMPSLAEQFARAIEAAHGIKGAA